MSDEDFHRCEVRITLIDCTDTYRSTWALIMAKFESVCLNAVKAPVTCTFNTATFESDC